MEVKAKRSEKISGHNGYTLGPMPTDNQYVSSNVSIKLLTSKQRTNLFRLTAGLSAQGATLENGLPVDDTGRAIRYLLEQLK